MKKNNNVYQLRLLEKELKNWEVYFVDSCYEYKLLIDNKIDLSVRQNKKILRYLIVNHFFILLNDNSNLVFLIDEEKCVFDIPYCCSKTLRREFLKALKQLHRSFPCNFVYVTEDMISISEAERDNYILLLCRNKWNFKYKEMQLFLKKNGIDDKILSKATFKTL